MSPRGPTQHLGIDLGVTNLKWSLIETDGESWQSIAARQSKGYVNAATLAIMNDRDVSAQPQPGDRVKIVVDG